MTIERDSMIFNGVPEPALGDEERSDEAPRAAANAAPTPPDPEVGECLSYLGREGRAP